MKSSNTKKLDTALVRGMAWTAGAKWATQLITWASVLVAARLLSTSDFGLGDMAGLFAAVTSVLAEFGIGAAVTQIRELDRRALGQLHTVSILLGTAAFGFAVLMAPLLARFFRSSDLKLLLIVNSVHFFITGFQSVPLGLLQKDMDYRRLSLAEAAMAVSQAITLTVCAMLRFGYWSLVAATLTGHAVAALFAVYWKPVHFGLPRAQEILPALRMGWHVAVSRAAWAAYAQADAIVVGRTMGSGVLGAYRLAVNLASAPAEKIGTLVMRVATPLFAKVQSDTGMVRRYFLIFTDTLALGICPLMLGLSMVAPDFTSFVLGPKWAATAAPLRWLALYVVLRTMNTLMGQVLTSLRHTRFVMWISLLTAAVMVTSFLIAARWGPGAVAAAWLVMAPITIAPLAVRLFRAIGLSSREYGNVLAPALVGSAAMAAAVLAVAAWLPGHLQTSLRLGLQVAVGMVVYCTILLVAYRQRILRYAHVLRQIWKERLVQA